MTRHHGSVVSELDRIDRLDDLDTAKEWAKLYVKENARLKRKLAEAIEKLAKVSSPDAAKALQIELAALHEQLGQLQQRVFGESSERRAKPEPKAAKKPQTGHGPRAQDKLPREQKLLELPEHKRICMACNGPLEEMKGQVETSEQITMRAREYLVQVLVAQKYRCKCGIGVHTAPKPLTHIKGGRYSMDFAIEVAIDKYINHLPLDRQRRMMARANLVVDTQTLWDQIEGLARHLEPTYDALKKYILDADVVGADETWWRLMDGEGSKRWWAWQEDPVARERGGDAMTMSTSPTTCMRRLVDRGRAILLSGAMALLGTGCYEDTSGTETGMDGGTGCAECANNDIGPFGCECKLGAGPWAALGSEDICLDPQFDPTARCTAECQNAHTDPNYVGRVADNTCAEGISISCTNWNPASHISLSFGVYEIDETWFATLVADPRPLWGCDDAELHPHSDYTRFVVTNLNSGEFLYEIGLRNNDKIMSLNSIPLNAFAAGYTAFALYLNGTTAYTLTVQRGSSTITMSISLV